MVWVADGYYRLRLTDSNGDPSNGGFDYPSVPSIGPSTTGGSGGSVDANTILQTGDVKWRPVDGALTGWVRMNGRTIGNALSGAGERANADTEPLFSYMWSTYADSVCAVSGGRGASAAADYAAGKTITLLDMRGKFPCGLDTMGATSAALLTAATFSLGDGSTAASYGGEATHTLVKAEVPVQSVSGNTGNDTPDHSHSGLPVWGSVYYDGANWQNGYPYSTGGSTSGASTRHTHPFTASTDGGGGPHNNYPPFVTGTWYWKL
jgi:hypothetical protein